MRYAIVRSELFIFESPSLQKGEDVISFPVDSELYSLMLLFEACLTYHTDATGIDINSLRILRLNPADATGLDMSHQQQRGRGSNSCLFAGSILKEA
jgi:hypothetical protein